MGALVGRALGAPRCADMGAIGQLAVRCGIVVRDVRERGLRHVLRRAAVHATREAMRDPLVADLLGDVTDRIIDDLGRAPATYALVDRVVHHLGDQPEFFQLVDRTVDYLVRHPEVQALIHEQSKSLMEDAVGDLRSHAAQADDAIGRVVARLRAATRTR